jgi:hypothetical protein
VVSTINIVAVSTICILMESTINTLAVYKMYMFVACTINILVVSAVNIVAVSTIHKLAVSIMYMYKWWWYLQ